jgi:hypothetical protein
MEMHKGVLAEVHQRAIVRREATVKQEAVGLMVLAGVATEAFVNTTDTTKTLMSGKPGLTSDTSKRTIIMTVAWADACL